MVRSGFRSGITVEVDWILLAIQTLVKPRLLDIDFRKKCGWLFDSFLTIVTIFSHSLARNQSEIDFLNNYSDFIKFKILSYFVSLKTIANFQCSIYKINKIFIWGERQNCSL